MVLHMAGYVAAVTSRKQMSHADRTAAAMHHTAEQLEVAEAVLHRSAEQFPNAETTARLHALGDQVTEQAHEIDRRANRLTAETDQASHLEPAARHRPLRDVPPDGKQTPS